MPAEPQRLTPHDTEARTLAVLARLVEETHPGRRRDVSLDSDLERELGLDSLARVELVLRLGREFGQTLPDAALADAETARQLLGYLGRSPDERSEAAQDFVRQGAVGLPDAARSLVEVLEHFVVRAPEQTHVLLYGEGGETESISHAALFKDARRIATGLVSRGLEPRQTVALMLPTSRAYLSSFFGTLLAGGIPVPIYPPARLSQIEDHLRRHSRILGNAQAAFMVTIPQAKPVAALLRAAVPSLKEIITPEELAVDPMPLLYRADPQDVAFLQYTSGSTGDPKGVVLTHANLLANVRAMGRAAAVSGQDVFVSWLPLYHDMGLIGAWFGSLYHGFPLVLMSPLAFLARPARWLRAISQHRGTLAAAPNFAYELCARKLDDEELQGIDLSSWRLAFNGAEPVSPATLEAFARRFAPYGFRRTALTPVYGLAECSLALAFPPLDRGPRIDRVSRDAFMRRAVALPAGPGDGDALEIPACGRALEGHEMRVVDAAGAELAERHIGRLQFRGPSATSGYYRNPEATRKLLQGDWLNTGDYAYLAEGELYLTGREKDLIIRGGRNLYPYELEEAVGQLPGVRKGCVAVFASAKEGGSERLVVLAETREQDEAVRQALQERINGVAIDVIGMPPDEIVLAPPHTVLKTSSGKIRRAASREAFEKGLIGQAAQPRWRVLARLYAQSALATGRFALRRMAVLGYGAYLWLVFVLLGLPVALLVIGARSPRFGRQVARLGARAWLALSFMPAQCRGLERLPGPPHLLLINHASYLDGPLLTALLPPRYAFVAKRELTQQPFIRAFLEGLGALFVERFDVGKGVEDVEAIIAALQAGQSLAIFPEGTFSREAGLKPFRMGAFVAAVRAGVPVAVAGLRGVRAVLRDRTWLPRFGRIELEIGASVTTAGSEWAEAARLRDTTRAQMLQLCGEHDLSG